MSLIRDFKKKKNDSSNLDDFLLLFTIRFSHKVLNDLKITNILYFKCF